MNASPGTQKKIGLALGSGASRGWSHIGVLKALLSAGIEPDVVCGTSVGAMVGGSYVSGNLDRLEDWVLGSSRTDVLSFFNFRLARTAFVDIERLNWFLHSFVAAAEVQIEDLNKPYAAVCTNLENGREVWLEDGNLADAIRASMAMPGLFPAVHNDERWLVDGGLVNPVPVSACRKLGADIVIGVNLNSDILSRHNHEKSATTAPGLFSTVAMSINIFQDQITRGRLDADPADIVIAPKVGDIRMLDFQRAADAIEEGEARVQSAMGEIRKLVETQ